MAEFRTEKDFLGEVKVPKDALWGVQTQRAVENFPISGLRFGRRFLYALGLIKKACAEANLELGLLDPKLAKAIVQASEEVMAGTLDSQFPVDIFQTGSGTSTNMNANEVIANRANVLLGIPLGGKGPIHPNDHVNMGQSSNDVIPTAIHVAALLAVEKDLIPALRELEGSLGRKAKEFDPIVKAGRTHLMDATPIRLGQEFSGYESQVSHGIRRVSNARPSLAELAMEVLGNDATIAVANSHSNLDLCTMMPVMAYDLQQSIEILANVARVFAHKCVDGITANEAVLRRNAEMSTAIVTRLNPIIGYEKAAELAKESARTGVPIKQLVIEKKLLSPQEAEKLLDPRVLTEPSKDLLGSGGG